MLSLLQDVMLAPFSSPTASNGLALTRGPRVVAPATCAKQLPNSLYRYIMWCKGPVGPAPLLNTGLLVDDEFWRVKFQRSDCRGGSCVLSSLYHSLPPPLIAAANKNRLKLDLRLFKAHIYIYIHIVNMLIYYSTLFFYFLNGKGPENRNNILQSNSHITPVSGFYVFYGSTEECLRHQTRDDALEQSIQRRQEKGCWRLAAGR